MYLHEDNIAGVKRGKQMTFKQADSGKVNPHYSPYTPTSENCQSCVVAFKARLEGYDVQAKPWNESNKIMVNLSEDTSIAWVDKETGSFPEYIRPHENYVPRLTQWLNENLKENNYYTIEFFRKYIPDGHIMIIFKDSNTMTLYDPQSDEIIQGDDISLLLYTVRKNSIKLLNISNCNLNKAVVDYVLEARI